MNPRDLRKKKKGYKASQTNQLTVSTAGKLFINNREVKPSIEILPTTKDYITKATTKTNVEIPL